MSKRQKASINCYCCGVKNQMLIDKPQIFQPTRTSYECPNCEGQYLLRVEKLINTGPNEVHFSIIDIKMTQKTEKMYQEKRDEYESQA